MLEKKIPILALAAGVLATPALAGCSGSSSPSPAGSATAAATGAPTTGPATQPSSPVPPSALDTAWATPLSGAQLLLTSGTGSRTLQPGPLPAAATSVTYRLTCRSGSYTLAYPGAKPFSTGGCAAGTAISVDVPRAQVRSTTVQLAVTGNVDWTLDVWAITPPMT